MKILAPLTCSDYYSPLVEAGADEFFIGFVPYFWLKENSNITPLNAKEGQLLRQSNISAISEIKTIKKLYDKFKVPVKAALNSHYYLKEDYPKIVDSILILMDMGINTFIIADPALLIYLRENNINCDIHLSNEYGIFNSLEIEFLNQFNVARYIFPRRTVLQEMQEIIQKANNPRLEFEAFVLNSLCSYSGCYCNCFHCEEMYPICGLLYANRKTADYTDRFKLQWDVLNKLNDKYSKQKNFFPIISNRMYSKPVKEKSIPGGSGCGLCRIHELGKIGITHLKVVGRGAALAEIVRDVSFLKKILGMCNNVSASDEFVKIVKHDLLSDSWCEQLCYYRQ